MKPNNNLPATDDSDSSPILRLRIYRTMRHNNYRYIRMIAHIHPYSIKKYRVKLKRHSCPVCKKYMLRYQWFREYWWQCSGRGCFVNAKDERCKPKFLTPKQSKESYFLDQLQYISNVAPLAADLRAKVLIRMIQRKGLNGLPSKYFELYHTLIEPVRKSISFAQCRDCGVALNKKESLHLGKGKYLCDACFSY